MSLRKNWLSGKNLYIRPNCAEPLRLRSNLLNRRKMAADVSTNAALSFEIGTTCENRARRSRVTSHYGSRAAISVRKPMAAHSRHVPSPCGCTTNCLKSTSVGRGTPTASCCTGTFIGSSRNECLPLHWFEKPENAKRIAEVWLARLQRESSSLGSQRIDAS